MNSLTLFGLFAVTAMLVCYALEARHTLFVLGFAFACALGSLYGFLQGAWPFGVVEAIWSLVAARKWWLARAGLTSMTDKVDKVDKSQAIKRPTAERDKTRRLSRRRARRI